MATGIPDGSRPASFKYRGGVQILESFRAVENLKWAVVQRIAVPMPSPQWTIRTLSQ